MRRSATPATLITADAGYHSEANLAALAERGIDALIADNAMRRRDERFADQAKHLEKPDPLYDKSRRPKKASVFGAKRIVIADDQSHAICPAGQRLYRNGKDCTVGGYAAIKFRTPASACEDCALRTQCLRKPDTTPSRQVAVLTRKAIVTHTQRMRERIDSETGREEYGRRFATVERVFGNLRHNKQLNRFTLRGQKKVDGQWSYTLSYTTSRSGRNTERRRETWRESRANHVSVLPSERSHDDEDCHARGSRRPQ